MTRTENVRARVTVGEYRALVTLAESEQRNPSEMLRELIRQEAQRRGLWPPAVQSASLPARSRDTRQPGAPLQARVRTEEA